MDFSYLLFLILSVFLTSTAGENIDGCPPADPNCHPSCIVYTADHCRYCMCKDGTGSSSSSSHSSSSSGFGGSISTDAAWDRGFEGGDWSNKMDNDYSAWSNSAGKGEYSSAGFGSSSGNHEETVKYVIVEKEPEPQIPSYSRGGLSPLPNPFLGGLSSPFGGGSVPSSLLPGSNNIIDSHAYGNNVIHVPLLAPGIPKYCVRCKILSCPGTCERVDEYGCRSCPCAPSRYQTMPVMRDCSSEPQVMQPDCSATKLCIETCKDGYKLGEAGRDGCQSCTCIRRATPTPQPEPHSCPETLKCMLQCKDGYLLGEKKENGCPSCKCLAKNGNKDNESSGTNSNNFNNGNNNFGTGNGDFGNWNKNQWNTNGGSGTGSGTGSGGRKNCSGGKSNYLTSVNGIGSGKCEPPMCLSGSMSIDDAMSIGAASAGGGGGSNCDEGNSGSGMIDMGSLAGGSGSSSGMMMGGFGSGQGMGSSGGAGGASASGKGMPSPFDVSMSGAGAGAGAGGMGIGMGGGGTSGGGMLFSPFSSAMSGGGPGMGLSGGPGAMSRGGGSSAMGTETSVTAVAYNKDCTGAECSTKNRMQHADCPDLLHCLVTCDGKYLLGQLDENGCQTCTCTS